MVRQKRFQVRLTEDEWARLLTEANRRNVSMSEVIQDYIKKLPKPKALNEALNNVRDLELL